MSLTRLKAFGVLQNTLLENSYNDQSFDNLNNLIIHSFKEYKKSNLNVKLWARFWKTLEMYNNST